MKWKLRIKPDLFSLAWPRLYHFEDILRLAIYRKLGEAGGGERQKEL